MRLTAFLLLAAVAAVAQQRRNVSDSDIGYRIGQIDAKIEALRGEAKRVDDRIAGVDTRLGGLDTKVAAISNATSTMDERVRDRIVGNVLTREQAEQMIGVIEHNRSEDYKALNRQIDEIRERMRNK
jgi:septal ring factor EnvC (AmiA/AmiB activator)